MAARVGPGRGSALGGVPGLQCHLLSPQMFEFYERVSGARMHAAYVRPGGVHQVSPPLVPGVRRG